MSFTNDCKQCWHRYFSGKCILFYDCLTMLYLRILIFYHTPCFFCFVCYYFVFIANLFLLRNKYQCHTWYTQCKTLHKHVPSKKKKYKTLISVFELCMEIWVSFCSICLGFCKKNTNLIDCLTHTAILDIHGYIFTYHTYTQTHTLRHKYLCCIHITVSQKKNKYI